MISRIRGTIERVGDNRAELRCGELCYEVLVPAYLETALRLRTGEAVELYVHHYLEGGVGGAPLVPRLVGFMSASERAFYNHLLKVPGLGAKSVLRLLVSSPAEMARAIEQEDRGALAALPGVGRRTADKIIAELKGRLSEFAFGESSPAAAGGPPVAWGEAEDDAVRVLVQLAYKPGEAEQLVRAAKRREPALTGAGAEALVQAVLKKVGSEAVR
jgi:holliday junction DNA helicase RuvA